MILFVFEGDRDTRVFNTLMSVFFPDLKESPICVYRSNIYSLYSKLKDYDPFNQLAHDGDTVSVLREILREKDDTTLEHVVSSDISEIYLFFDYDFQHKRGTLKENNECVRKMLAYFDNETDNGKLYIHYPMLESIRYTKELPDRNYGQYVVNREDCRGFKTLANEFSAYPSLDHICLPEKALSLSTAYRQKCWETICQNWKYLVQMNVRKAHSLCKEVEAFPVDKDLIRQTDIYANQLRKHVNQESCRVSILNAFPLFLYDYFEKDKFDDKNR